MNPVELEQTEEMENIMAKLDRLESSLENGIWLIVKFLLFIAFGIILIAIKIL